MHSLKEIDTTARLLSQTGGKALVAMIFSIAPAQGTRLSVLVAAGCALAAAVVSLMRVKGRTGAAKPTHDPRR
jgi:DHA2 family multidrug resistance protein-like MFS transporter